MNIRYAEMKDIAAITAVEAECFPPAEAATEKDFVERVRYYGKHFWLMHDGEKLIAFMDGFVTDEPDLTDEMYENAAMHNENGAWQMIFGVNTLPEYRRHGYAGTLLRRTIDDAQQQIGAHRRDHEAQQKHYDRDGQHRQRGFNDLFFDCGSVFFQLS